MSDAALDLPYAGHIADGEHRFAVRIYYEDTDAGGVVYHARYLAFFERARADLLTAIGADHLGILAREGSAYVVSEATLKYRRPARLGEALVIVSTLDRIRAAGAVVHQRVMRNTEVVVEGCVSVVFVGPDGRPRRQPATWIQAFQALTSGANAPA